MRDIAQSEPPHPQHEQQSRTNNGRYAMRMSMIVCIVCVAGAGLSGIPSIEHGSSWHRLAHRPSASHTHIVASISTRPIATTTRTNTRRSGRYASHRAGASHRVASHRPSGAAEQHRKRHHHTDLLPHTTRSCTARRRLMLASRGPRGKARRGACHPPPPHPRPPALAGAARHGRGSNLRIVQLSS